MIIAAGLTPAWQQILRFHGFQAGEVNRAVDVHWCASGKVLNVGIALACLGAVAGLLSRSSGGHCLGAPGRREPLGCDPVGNGRRRAENARQLLPGRLEAAAVRELADSVVVELVIA